MIYDPSILQDYTEAFKQHSNSRFLDLFQSRYVHSLIVSLTRNEKNIAFLVVAPFPLKTRLISLLYQLKWFRLELGWCYWYSLEGTMPLLLIQALYSMKLVTKLRDFRIASIVNNNIKKNCRKGDMDHWLMTGFSTSIGTISMAIIQVLDT